MRLSKCRWLAQKGNRGPAAEGNRAEETRTREAGENRGFFSGFLALAGAFETAFHPGETSNRNGFPFPPGTRCGAASVVPIHEPGVKNLFIPPRVLRVPLAPKGEGACSVDRPSPRHGNSIADNNKTALEEEAARHASVMR